MYGAVDMLIVGRFGTAAAPSAVLFTVVLVVFAAPAATVFGIALCFIYYKRMQKEMNP